MGELEDGLVSRLLFRNPYRVSIVLVLKGSHEVDVCNVLSSE
jgi:hypothetical protein